jgi:hypothetical protein
VKSRTAPSEWSDLDALKAETLLAHSANPGEEIRHEAEGVCLKIRIMAPGDEARSPLWADMLG